MINKKLLFTLIPKIYWIILFLGIFLRLIGGVYLIPSYSILTILSIFIFIKAAVILHEIGHLVFAKIVGGQPRRLILGNGHEVSRFKIKNLKIIINNSFIGGFAMAIFNTTSFLKWRTIIYTSGGFLLNIIIVYLFYLAFDYNYLFFITPEKIDFTSTFIFTNLLIATLSLIPYQSNYMGVKISSDGLSLLKLPFTKINKVKALINSSELFDAFEYLEQGEFDKAEGIYRKYLLIPETKYAASINLGTVYIKMGKINSAKDILVDLTKSSDNKKNKSYKALVYNNLAWTFIAMQKFEEADKYSKIAYELNPKEKHFQGTRGAALIGVNNIDLGIQMLHLLVDFNYPNSQTISAAMFLNLAYAKKENTSESMRYYDFVESNIQHLGADELIIWNYIKNRIESNAVQNPLDDL